MKRDEHGRPVDIPVGMRHWPEGRNDIADKYELRRLYDRGYMGAYKDQEATEQLHATFGSKQTFGDWAGSSSGLAGSGVGKLALLYLYVLKLHPKAYRVAQRRGDCVSFSFANACDAVRATEILLEGQAEGWVNETSPEWLYWGRGHSGEGASCATIGEWVSRRSGMMLRKNYPDLNLDLSEYNPRIGQDGRSGPPQRMIDVAKRHPMQTLTRIASIEEARDAIANGHALSCCSGLSFSDKRDSRGIARRTSGGWAHAMAWTAVDARQLTVDKHGGPLFMVQNSWGNWNGGGWHSDYGQCPTGAFWILPDDAEAAIRNGGTYAVADATGFAPKTLPSLGARGRL